MYKDKFIKIDSQNAFIREPLHSNGIGIIIIGGSNGYVTESTSDFHEDVFRNNFLNELSEKGYTIGYSNAYNLNWGNKESVKNIEDLADYMLKEYNLHEELNIIAISMGGVLVINLIENQKIKLDNILLLKPVLDLNKHRKHIFIKEKKDRILKEVMDSYNIKEAETIDLLNKKKYFNKEYCKNLSIKIIHGELDDLILHTNNIEIIQELAVNIKNLSVIELKGASHKDNDLFFNIDCIYF